MKMIESLSEVVEEVPNNESQIPAPVTIPEAPETVDRYDDEDVELIWNSMCPNDAPFCLRPVVAA